MGVAGDAQVVLQKLLLIVGVVARGARHLRELRARRGQLVGAFAGNEHDGVAGAGGGQPRGAQHLSVGATDDGRVVELGEEIQRVQGGGGAQLLVGVGVLHGQKLHGPLHVRERAAPELGVGGTVGAAGQTLVVHAGFDAADFPDVGGFCAAGRVAEGVDGLQERIPHAAVAGDDCGAQQRLAFPDFAPFAVVALVAGDGAHHRAGAALRAQPQIHFEGRVSGGLRQAGAHLVDDLRRPGDSAGFIGRFARFGDDHHVGVGAVAEFGAAEAAHADDGDAGRRLVVRRGCEIRVYLGAKCRLEDGLPHVGQLEADLARLHETEQVGGRDAGELRAAQRARHGDGLVGVRLVALGGGDDGFVHLVGGGVEEPGAVGAVAEEFDHIWCGDDQVGGVRRGAQDVHEALRRHAFVAQHAQEPAAVDGGVGKLAVVQQALAGIGGVREPVHQARQQDRLQLGLARGALDQRGEVIEGARRVAVAKRGQLGLDRVRGEGGFADGHVRHRAQQRAVEQPLMQVGDVAAHAFELAVHRVRGGAAVVRGEPGGAGEPAVALLVVRLGQLVGAFEALQLQPVLQQAQKLVCLGEHARVLAPHVTRRGQGRQGVEGVAGAQGVVDAPVHELQQLHGELDVAKPAGAEFELAASHLGRNVFQHAPAHGLDVLDEGIALGRLPHQRRDRLGVRPPQFHRPGLRPRLQ